MIRRFLETAKNSHPVVVCSLSRERVCVYGGSLSPFTLSSLYTAFKHTHTAAAMPYKDIKLLYVCVCVCVCFVYGLGSFYTIALNMGNNSYFFSLSLLLFFPPSLYPKVDLIFQRNLSKREEHPRISDNHFSFQQPVGGLCVCFPFFY